MSRAQRQREDHLRYLLTAYIFGDLSAAGRREVEAHLAACPECRREHDELRETAAFVAEALAEEEADEPYVFELRRRERVLEASRKRRTIWLQPWWSRAGLAAAAVLVAIVTPSWFLVRSIREKNLSAPMASMLGGDNAVNERGYASSPPMTTTASSRFKSEQKALDPRQGALSQDPGRPGAPAGHRGRPDADGNVVRAPSPAKKPANPASSVYPPVDNRARRATANPTTGRDSVRAGTELAFADDEISKDTVSLSGMSNKNLDSASVVNAYGVGGGAAGLPASGPESGRHAQRQNERPEGRWVAEDKKTRSKDRESQLAAPAEEALAEAEAEGPASNASAARSNQLARMEAAAAAAAAGLRAEFAAMETTRSTESAQREYALRKVTSEEKERISAELQAHREERVRLVEDVALQMPTLEGLERRRLEQERGLKEKAARRIHELGDERASEVPGVDPLLTLSLGQRARTTAANTATRTPQVYEQYRSPGDESEPDVVLLGLLRGQSGEQALFAGGKTNDFDGDKFVDTIALSKNLKTAAEQGYLGQSKRQTIDAFGKANTEHGKLGQLGRKRALRNNAGSWQIVPAAGERAVRAFWYYKALDPQLTVEGFRARGLEIPRPAVGDEGLGRERFRERFGVNPFVDTSRDHLSTFAMDVDTAAYTRARALLRAGRLPDPKSVRTEEFINAFQDARPADPGQAFSVFCEGGPSPFGDGTELLEVTVKARDLSADERQSVFLTFCIDTSGSMVREGRLGQVEDALSGLLAQLQPDDRVAVVAYGSEAYLALPHTPARERERILSVLGSLSASGSTNVEAGLDLAYRLADEAFYPSAMNRIVLCSDGVATRGARGTDEVIEKVQVFARRGIYLSVVGFGRTRYNDAFLESLANKGNGNYAFVDSAGAAQRLFSGSLPQTLQVLARDAKIQVDFDPATVQQYRLLGYENRDVADVDFRNDAVDAGEVGPGTSVTALYEIRRHPHAHGPLGRVFVRYHAVAKGAVEELDFPLPPGVLQLRLDQTSDRFRHRACLAELAELLRGSYYARNGTYADVLRALADLSPAWQARPEWRELAELAIRAQALELTRGGHRR